MNPFTQEPFTKTEALGIKCMIGKDYHELYWIKPGDFIGDWMVKAEKGDGWSYINLGQIVNDENFYWIPCRDDRLPTS